MEVDAGGWGNLVLLAFIISPHPPIWNVFYFFVPLFLKCPLYSSINTKIQWKVKVCWVFITTKEKQGNYIQVSSTMCSYAIHHLEMVKSDYHWFWKQENCYIRRWTDFIMNYSDITLSAKLKLRCYEIC